MSVFKATFTVTVLVDADDQADAKQALEKATLSEIGDEMFDGEWIGQMGAITVAEVPEDKIRDELFAIGNDGTFFDPTF